MSRLIDADKLKEDFLSTVVREECLRKETQALMVKFVYAEIDAAPTVDPVKRGKWVEDVGGMPICSCCKHPAYHLMRYTLFDYCPFCGAKMGGESE